MVSPKAGRASLFRHPCFWSLPSEPGIDQIGRLPNWTPSHTAHKSEIDNGLIASPTNDGSSDRMLFVLPSVISNLEETWAMCPGQMSLCLPKCPSLSSTGQRPRLTLRPLQNKTSFDLLTVVEAAGLLQPTGLIYSVNYSGGFTCISSGYSNVK